MNPENGIPDSGIPDNGIVADHLNGRRSPGLQKHSVAGYSRSWQRYRRLRKRLLLLGIVFIFGPWVFKLGIEPAFGRIAASFYFVLLVGCIIWMLWANAQLEAFPCPRCGNEFAGGHGFWSMNWGVWARKCQHCDLKKFASDSTE